VESGSSSRLWVSIFDTLARNHAHKHAFKYSDMGTGMLKMNRQQREPSPGLNHL